MGLDRWDGSHSSCGQASSVHVREPWVYGSLSLREAINLGRPKPRARTRTAPRVVLLARTYPDLVSCNLTEPSGLPQNHPPQPPLAPLVQSGPQRPNWVFNVGRTLSTISGGRLQPEECSPLCEGSISLMRRWLPAAYGDPKPSHPLWGCPSGLGHCTSTNRYYSGYSGSNRN